MSDQAKVDILGIIGAEIDRAGNEAFPVGRALIAARNAVSELIDHNRIMREALTKLARAPGCGCSPICRCGEGDWTRYELEGRMDEAQAALAKATGETT